MMGTGNPVYLLNVERGEQEAAELLDMIAEKQLADWEGEWAPVLFRAMQRLRRTASMPTLAIWRILELTAVTITCAISK